MAPQTYSDATLAAVRTVACAAAVSALRAAEHEVDRETRAALRPLGTKARALLARVATPALFRTAAGIVEAAGLPRIASAASGARAGGLVADLLVPPGVGVDRAVASVLSEGVRALAAGIDALLGGAPPAPERRRLFVRVGDLAGLAGYDGALGRGLTARPTTLDFFEAWRRLVGLLRNPPAPLPALRSEAYESDPVLRVRSVADHPDAPYLERAMVSSLWASNPRLERLADEPVVRAWPYDHEANATGPAVRSLPRLRGSRETGRCDACRRVRSLRYLVQIGRGRSRAVLRVGPDCVTRVAAYAGLRHRRERALALARAGAPRPTIRRSYDAAVAAAIEALGAAARRYPLGRRSGSGRGGRYFPRIVNAL